MVWPILKTLVYADVFDYPLTAKEIKKWLIGPSTSKVALDDSLEVLFTFPYFHLSGRQSLVKLRRQRQRFSQLKWSASRRTVKLLRLIPWIHLIAVTGALAMNNSDKNDDIDLMIITAKNRLWLTRLLCVAILEILGQRRRPAMASVSNKICLNLFLDESALVLPQSQRNLYTAHELVQVKPLFDRGNTYQKFLAANNWVKKYLPNALQGDSLKVTSSEVASGGVDFFESLAFKIQYQYMRPKITNEKISRHFAFFHPRPSAQIILKKYHERLKHLRSGRLRSNLKEEPRQNVEADHAEGKVRPYRKVLVTGCFDVLHSQHIKFLKAAKKVGNILLVGVETDRRVRQLKGPGRPVNPLPDRLQALRRLNIADQVFALPKQFNNLNHFSNFIQKIKPDILAVSSSTPHLAIKRRIIKKFGGRVKIVLSYNPKISTTKLINK